MIKYDENCKKKSNKSIDKANLFIFQRGIRKVSLGPTSASYTSALTACSETANYCFSWFWPTQYTSNEAERSFSQLKGLLTSRRTTMGEQRLNNLMGAHRSRLSEISNAIVIEKFNGKKRMVTFAGDTVIEDDENWEDNTLNLLLIFFIQNYLWNLTMIF